MVSNLNRFVLLPVLAFLSLSVWAADTPAVRRAREQFRWFKPEAARLALADLKQNPRYDSARWSRVIEGVIAHQQDIAQWLASNDPAENARAVPYMMAYRGAMLANPLLDGDPIVCTRYRYTGSRTNRFDDKSCYWGDKGIYGINAHNEMWLWRDRINVDASIGILSDLRADNPKFETVYAPTDHTPVR